MDNLRKGWDSWDGVKTLTITGTFPGGGCLYHFNLTHRGAKTRLGTYQFSDLADNSEQGRIQDLSEGKIFRNKKNL